MADHDDDHRAVEIEHDTSHDSSVSELVTEVMAAEEVPRARGASIMTEEQQKALQKKTEREIKALIAWANNFLAKRDLHVSQLGRDFSDGVMLINLLELLFGGSVGRYCARPKQAMQKLDNMSMALTFMRKNGVVLLSVDQNMLANGSVRHFIMVLWNMLRVALFKGIGVSDQHKLEEKNMRETLLGWVVKSGFNIADFWASLKDGTVLCAIIDKLVPHAIDMAKVNKDHPKENLELAFSTAETHLKIPPLLTASDVLDGKPDEQTMMSYIAMLMSAASASQSAARKDEEAKRLAEEVARKKAELEEKEKEFVRNQQQSEAVASALTAALEKNQAMSESEAKWKESVDSWRNSSKKWAQRAQEWNDKFDAKSKEFTVVQDQLSKIQADHEAEIQALYAEVYKIHKEYEEVVDRVSKDRKQTMWEQKQDAPSHRMSTSMDMTHRMTTSASKQKKLEIASNLTIPELIEKMADKKGWLMFRRPKLKDRQFKKLYFILHGETLYWTEQEAKGSEKIKLKKSDSQSLKGFTFCVSQQDLEGGKHVTTIRLEGKANNAELADKLIELRALPEDDQGPKSLPRWIHAFNLRISLLNYVEIQSANKEFGCQELIIFMTEYSTNRLEVKDKLLGIHDPLLVLKYGLVSNPSLMHLHLEAVSVNDKTVELLSDIIAANPFVLTLALPNNQVTAVGAGHLAEALKHNKSLKHISLDNNQLRDEGVQKLAAALPDHPNLSGIGLRGNAVSDDGVKSLTQFLALSQHKNGKPHSFPTFDLSYNVIGDVGMGALAVLCHLNPTITELYLDNNAVGDVGLSALSDALINSPNIGLKAIYLASNSISSKGVIALSKAFKVFKNELLVDISDNKLVSRTGVAALCVDIDVMLDYVQLKIFKKKEGDSDGMSAGRSRISHSAASE